MNTYINTYGSTSFSVSCDITDSSDMKSINFANTSGVKFFKTFYLAHREGSTYKLIIINVKLIGKCIYIYRINDNKRKLLKVIETMENVSSEILCALVRVDTNWEVLSIPSESHILLISVKSILTSKLKYKKLTMDMSLMEYLTKNKRKFSIYSYRDRAIVIYQNSDDKTLLKTMYCDSSKLSDKVINLNELFESDVKLQSIRTSDNGNFILLIKTLYDKKYSKTMRALNLSTNKVECFDTSNIKINKENKFLISNDGKILLCKYRNNSYLLTNKSMYEIGTYIPDYKSNFEKYNLSMINVGLYDDICSNVVVFWNKDNQDFHFLGVNIINGQIHISKVYNKSLLSSSFSKNTKISTNGKVYVYKSDNGKIKINDVSLFLYIPLIKSYLNVLLNDLLKLSASEKVNKIGDFLLLGNLNNYPKSIKKSRLTDNLRLVFNPVHTDDKFVLETYDRLDIPIIEGSIKKSDRLHVVMSIIDDIDNTDILFNAIRTDELYHSKIDLVMDLFKDLYEKIDTSSNKELPKRYIELCILHVMINHRLISDKMSSVLKSICTLIGINIDKMF